MPLRTGRPNLCSIPGTLPENGQVPPRYLLYIRTAGFQPGVPVANHSAAPSTTSSLLSDPTILAAKIILLRAQLALAVVTAPVRTDSRRQQTPATRGYCLTLGKSGDVSHTSAMCNALAAGHQTAATNRNRMGGSALRDGRLPNASAPSAATATSEPHIV